jgi:carbonic anhydrase
MNAESALERLKAGNKRFVDDLSDGDNRYTSDRRGLVGGQQPFAVILGCSDSRVPPEIAFDTGLGELFVVRVAGNVANTSSIASVEYAVANLGTKLVVVLAHMNCGAVNAALSGAGAGKNLDHLLEHIRPALADPKQRDVNTVARRNASVSADRLVQESEIIRLAIERDGVRIVTAFYDLLTGTVEFDEPC